MADFPGKVFGVLEPLDSVEYGDPSPNRQIDLAPLTRLLCAQLGLDGDIVELMRALVEDDRDGPIHIAHLLGVCEYVARVTGGHVPAGAHAAGENLTWGLMMTSTAGHNLPRAAKAL